MTRSFRSRIPSPKFIRRYTELLKAQDLLSKLNYHDLRPQAFENVYIASQFKNLSSTMSSLQLQFQGNLMPERVQKIFFTRLASLKNLTQVKISFIYFNFKDSKVLSRLFKSLLYLNKLKNLSLRFNGGGRSKGNQVDIIAKYLRRLTQLQALQLDFGRSMSPPPDGDIQSKDILDHLPFVFSKLTNLTKVGISAEGRKQIEAQALIEIFKGLQNLKNLSDLTFHLPLTLAPYENPSDPETLSRCFASLNMSSIRKLNLHPYAIVDFVSLGELSRTLGKFTSLNTLCFSLYNSVAATEKSLADLGSALASLTSLYSLHLIFPYSKDVEFGGIGRIASALNLLQNLLELRLDFTRDSDIQLVELQQISTSLGNLARLQYLDLSFAFRKSLPDLAVISLSESLQKLVLLKSLSLNFRECMVITKTGINAIVGAIENLDGLSSLTLNFTKNPHIDDKVVNRIGLLLLSLPSLYSISLSLMECPKLVEKEDSLLGLFRCLKEARYIKEAFLEIPDSAMNQQEIQKMKQRRVFSFEIPESYDHSMEEKLFPCFE